MINEILSKLDEMIEVQKHHVECQEQVAGVEVVSYDRGRLDQLQEIRDLIKEKSAHGAATPMSTDINSLTQKQYNTDQEKIEPVKLAQEIFSLCMKIQEGEDGKVEHRRKGRCSGPTVFVDFYGHVAQLDVEISPDGWSEEEDRKEKFSFYLGDYWGHQQKERAIRCKERLTELLEEKSSKNEIWSIDSNNK